MKPDTEKVLSILASHENDPSNLIAILQDVQAEYNYLSEANLTLIADTLGLSVSKVYSVATFYENFSLEAKGKHIVKVCAGTGCIAGGAMKIYDNFKSECEARGLKVYVGLKHDTDEEKSLHVKMSGCHGFCEMGPLVHIEPMGVMYIHVKPEDCHEILEKTVLGGEIIDRLVYHLDGTAYPKQEEIPFYKKQHRVVLGNCGTADAEDIEEYIAKGGYSAFEKALFEMTDEEICYEANRFEMRGGGLSGRTAQQFANYLLTIK